MAKNQWCEMRELLCWDDAVQILSFISANSPELAQFVLATLPIGVPRQAIVHTMASQLWRTHSAAAITFAHNLPAHDQASITASLESIGFPTGETERLGAQLPPRSPKEKP